MARFKFQLATLLRLREATRDERRAELAEAFRADDVLVEQQEDATRQVSDLRDWQRMVMSGYLPFAF